MKTETVPIDSLTMDPNNARSHPEKNREAICASLKQFGQQRPVLVGRDNVIVAGNGTYDAANSLGWDSIDIVRTDLVGAEAMAYAIVDNRTTDLSEWDTDTLAAQLGELNNVDELCGNEFELSSLGFDDADVSEFLDEPVSIVEDEAPIDQAAELQKKWKTKAGQLWIIKGKQDHRLLCGDSTKGEDVSRVLDGGKAEMMMADPPYGVNYEGGHFHSGDVNVVRKREQLANDQTTDIYDEFLSVVLPFIDGPCYMWFAGTKALPVYQAVHDCGGVVSALLIWHKTNATYAAMNAQYKQRHEPLLYFKPKKSTLRWCGPTDAATLWEFKRDATNNFHPTQKPVEVIANAIKNHDAKTVFDPFLGSGTTLVACEQLGRRGFGIEISPAYCAVILERMMNQGCKCERE